MSCARALAAVLAAIAGAALGGCGGQGTAPHATPDAGGAVVNLYTWAEYLPQGDIEAFEKRTGIKVRVAYFDTNETLETTMLTGSSGYDVVIPSAAYFQRQVQSGVYRPLDKSQLPHLSGLDAALTARVARYDPGNVYGVLHTWGSFGLGYNKAQLAQALPGVPVDSWRVIFDPAFAARLAACGINVLDAPAAVTRIVLLYLGKDPDHPSTEDLSQVESVLMKIRPYVRTIDSSNYTEALANGDICAVVGYSGDMVQARNRARDARNGIAIGYAIPKEGSLLWFTLLAIPKDAPHATNALRLIDAVMEPQVLARTTNYTNYANANPATLPLIEPAIAADQAVYPTPAELERLHTQAEDSPQEARALTRIWQHFKTGQ